MKSKNARASVLKLLAEYPFATASDLAKAAGISRARVYQIMESEEIRPKRPPSIPGLPPTDRNSPAAIRRRAREQLNDALQSGKATKPDACSNCAQTGIRLEGHHDDYSKPLEVIWLCNRCHDKLHKMACTGRWAPEVGLQTSIPKATP